MKNNFSKQQLVILKEVDLSETDLASFSKKEIEDTIDKLSDLLVQRGLKEGDEPNEYGILIDDLIGVFNQELYK